MLDNTIENKKYEEDTLLDLQQLKSEIILSHSWTTQEDKKLQQAIENKNIVGTLQWVFDIIIESIGSSPQEAFWFQHIEYSEYYTLLQSTIHKLTIEELGQYIDHTKQEIENNNDIHQKLLLTYINSLCLNETTLRSTEKKEKLSNIQLMIPHIRPGDIMLINKSQKNLADNLLLQYDTTPIEVSHAILISDVNYEAEEITISHSTGNKTTWWAGVETRVSFKDYMKQFDKLWIAVVRPPQEVVHDLIINTDKKEGKKFDYSAVIKDKVIKNKKNDKYNCVELIAQSLPIDKIPEYRSQWTLPSDILKTFKPIYITYTP